MVCGNAVLFCRIMFYRHKAVPIVSLKAVYGSKPHKAILVLHDSTHTIGSESIAYRKMLEGILNGLLRSRCEIKQQKNAGV